jgi:hypothetical protein
LPLERARTIENLDATLAFDEPDAAILRQHASDRPLPHQDLPPACRSARNTHQEQARLCQRVQRAERGQGEPPVIEHGVIQIEEHAAQGSGLLRGKGSDGFHAGISTATNGSKRWEFLCSGGARRNHAADTRRSR